MLLDQGVVTHAQLRHALDVQRAAGHGRIGEWLDETCGISNDDVARALARQWNRPVLSTEGFFAERMALVVPEVLRETLGILPIRVAGSRVLYVAFEETMDAGAEAVLASMSGLVVESGLLPRRAYEHAERTLAAASGPRVMESGVADESQLQRMIADALFEQQPVSSQLACMHGRWWLRMFLEPAAMSSLTHLPASTEDVVDLLLTPEWTRARSASAVSPQLSQFSSAVS